jgi:hypothetical protein
MILNLTLKQLEDLKRGLIIATQQLDATDNKADIMLADGLEKIINIINEQIK